MRVNVLTLLIRFYISHQVAWSPFHLFPPPPSVFLSLSLSTHNLTHLCQGGLSGVVKLSIARKRSFIKADRRAGRLLKLITPPSHRKHGLLSVSNGPSPPSPCTCRETKRVWLQGK